MPKGKKRALSLDTTPDQEDTREEQRRWLLPVDTQLTIKLLSGAARSSVTNDAENGTVKAVEGVAPAPAPVIIEAKALAHWADVSVVRAWLRQKPPRASAAEGQAEVIADGNGTASGLADDRLHPWHLVRFEDGAERWVELDRWPFLVKPPERASKNSEDEEEPGRALMAAQTVFLSEESPVPAADPKAAKKAKTLGTGAEQRGWLSHLLRSSSAEEVASLVNEHGPQLDAVNVAAATHRLARCTQQDARHVVGGPVCAVVRFCVDRARADRLQGYSAQGCANMCWGLAKLGLQTHSSVAASLAGDPEAEAGAPLATDARLISAVAEVFRLAAWKALMDIRWSACSDWTEVSNWCAEWATVGLWGGWKQQELANFCWAISRASGGSVDDALLRHFLCTVAQGAAISKWFGFSPQEMSNVMMALGSSGVVPPAFVHQALSKMGRHIGMFKPQELCLMLVSATRADLPSAELRPELMKVLGNAVGSELQGFNSIDVANLIWVLGVVRSRIAVNATKKAANSTKVLAEDVDAESEAFVRMAVAKAMGSLARWRPVEMVTLVHGLSRLAILDATLLGEVGSRWRGLLASAHAGETQEADGFGVQAQALSNLALAIAKVGHADPSLIKAMCMHARLSIRGGARAWRPLEATSVVWAGACSLAVVNDEEADQEATDGLASALGKLVRTIWSASQQGRWALGEHASALHVAQLALRAHATKIGSTLAWEPPEVALKTWYSAFHRRFDGDRADEDWIAGRSSFHRNVGARLEAPGFLDAIFPEGAHVRHEVDVEGLRVDIVIEPKGEGAPISVEVDGQSHFVRTLPAVESDEKTPLQLDGRSRLKHWILRHVAGHIVVSVSTYDWYACEKDDAKETKLLRRLLRRAVRRA